MHPEKEGKLKPQQISPRDFRIQRGSVRDPSRVGNKRARRRRIDSSRNLDIRQNGSFQRNRIGQRSNQFVLTKEYFRPLRVGHELRHPKSQRGRPVLRRGRAPHPPSRPRDQCVKRGPHRRNHLFRNSKSRLIEFSIPPVAVALAVLRRIPRRPGRGGCEAGEYKQRARLSLRHGCLGAPRKNLVAKHCLEYYLAAASEARLR